MRGQIGAAGKRRNARLGRQRWGERRRGADDAGSSGWCAGRGFRVSHGRMKRRPVPFDLGPVHFVGIGGIGMSAIAEIMLRLGYAVQGSDARAGPIIERLERLGAKIFIGHAREHIAGASAAVFTSAVGPDNPELAAARAGRVPLVRRAEMLAELMRMQSSV